MPRAKPKDELRAMVNHLQVLFPTMFPVIIRRVNWKPGAFGDCAVVKRKGKNRILIRINKSYDKWVQELILRHEYAHAMQWRPEPQEVARQRHHDAEFGAARGFIEWGLAEVSLWQLEEVGQ